MGELISYTFYAGCSESAIWVWRFTHVQKELDAVYNAYLTIMFKVDMYIFAEWVHMIAPYVSVLIVYIFIMRMDVGPFLKNQKHI